MFVCVCARAGARNATSGGELALTEETNSIAHEGEREVEKENLTLVRWYEHCKPLR